jgi:hypothetical protein
MNIDHVGPVLRLHQLRLVRQLSNRRTCKGVARDVSRGVVAHRAGWCL